MDAKHMLADFVAKTDAFTPDAKVKVLLVTAGVKPATFVPLMITPKNIDDKFHFEKHLKELGLKFIVSKPKSFERIKKVSRNKIKWEIEGVWYGYDILKNDKYLEMFKKYKKLARGKKMTQADKLGGKVYGYPAVCVNAFIKERDVRKLPKKYTYAQYFKRMHDIDWKFPFVSHVPHNNNCVASKNLNKKYRDAIKKLAPRFYKEFTKKRVKRVQLAINHENDLSWKGKLLWPEKNSHDYTAVTLKPVEGKYLLLSFLTKNEYAEGDVINAQLTLQYDAVKVKEGKKIKRIKNLHHERHFVA